MTHDEVSKSSFGTLLGKLFGPTEFDPTRRNLGKAALGVAAAATVGINTPVVSPANAVAGGVIPGLGSALQAAQSERIVSFGKSVSRVLRVFSSSDAQGRFADIRTVLASSGKTGEFEQDMLWTLQSLTGSSGSLFGDLPPSITLGDIMGEDFQALAHMSGHDTGVTPELRRELLGNLTEWLGVSPKDTLETIQHRFNEKTSDMLGAFVTRLKNGELGEMTAYHRRELIGEMRKTIPFDAAPSDLVEQIAVEHERALANEKEERAAWETDWQKQHTEQQQQQKDVFSERAGVYYSLKELSRRDKAGNPVFRVRFSSESSDAPVRELLLVDMTNYLKTLDPNFDPGWATIELDQDGAAITALRPALADALRTLQRNLEDPEWEGDRTFPDRVHGRPLRGS